MNPTLNVEKYLHCEGTMLFVKEIESSPYSGDLLVCHLNHSATRRRKGDVHFVGDVISCCNPDNIDSRSLITLRRDSLPVALIPPEGHVFIAGIILFCKAQW
jgi:hypothetical protein